MYDSGSWTPPDTGMGWVAPPCVYKVAMHWCSIEVAARHGMALRNAATLSSQRKNHLQISSKRKRVKVWSNSEALFCIVTYINLHISTLYCTWVFESSGFWMVRALKSPGAIAQLDVRVNGTLHRMGLWL